MPADRGTIIAHVIRVESEDSRGTAAGITIERVLSDKGSCYRSNLWAAACTQLGITPKRTRPYATETERRAGLDPWLHTYNHHRAHTALKGQPPASRVTNLSGQNS